MKDSEGGSKKAKGPKAKKAGATRGRGARRVTRAGASSGAPNNPDAGTSSGVPNNPDPQVSQSR